MNPEEILAYSPVALDQRQREFYFDEGYLSFPGLIGSSQLYPLGMAMQKLLDMSREIEVSNHQFDLEQGHNRESPRLRRVAYVDDLDEACWQFCKDSIVVDIAMDILGPNVRFRDLFINFKWAGGGAGVDWHQDIAFYPHTNVNTCQFLLALEDVDANQGPLQVVPGSHKGEIYSHYDHKDRWVGAISEEGLDKAEVGDAVALTGPAGSLSVHHSCMVHGSDKNMSDRGRPMMVMTYSAADAIPYTAAPYPSSHYGALVRGRQPRYAHHQALNMPLPPDWSGGYTSIFSHQDET